MGELAQTPEAKREAARAAIEARENGIRAAAIKQGRVAERADILKALGAQSLEEASQLAQIRAERDARPTQHAYGRHGMARFAQGGALGLALGMGIGAAVVSLAFQWSMRESFQNAADYGSRMVVSGAALQSANPAERCIPGEQLSDGRRCPQ